MPESKRRPAENKMPPEQQNDRSKQDDQADQVDQPGTQEKKEQAEEPGLKNLAAMGTELGLVVAVLALAGWWLDGKLSTTPWLLIAGAAFGIIGGLYKFWRTAKRFIE